MSHENSAAASPTEPPELPGTLRPSVATPRAGANVSVVSSRAGHAKRPSGTGTGTSSPRSTAADPTPQSQHLHEPSHHSADVGPPPAAAGSTKQQVRDLVEMLSKHLEAERSDSAQRQHKLRSWEEQQEQMLRAIEAEQRSHHQQQQQQQHVSGGNGADRRGSVPGAGTSVAESELLPYGYQPNSTTTTNNNNNSYGHQHHHQQEQQPVGSSHSALVTHPTANNGGPGSHHHLAPPTLHDDTAATSMEQRHAQQLQKKCEHLARVLVKTLRENKAYDETVVQLTDELTALRTRMTTLEDVASDRDGAAAELRAVKEVLRQRNEEVAAARTESRQRAAALERQAVAERETRRVMQAEKEAVLQQVSEQLSDVVGEHEEALDRNEAMSFVCDRAATDLRLAVRRGRELERRALAAERGLEAERTLRMAAEREANVAAVGGSGGGAETNGVGNTNGAMMTSPSSDDAAISNNNNGTNVRALQSRIARLEARLQSTTVTHAEDIRRLEETVSEAAEARDECERRAAELEATVRSLKRQLAQTVRDSTQHALAGQAARQRLVAIKRDAHAVTNLMSVTRVDTVHVSEAVRHDPELVSFVDRVTLDLTNLANFLAVLRSLDTEPPPTTSNATQKQHHALTALTDNAHTPARSVSRDDRSSVAPTPTTYKSPETRESRYIAPPADAAGNDATSAALAQQAGNDTRPYGSSAADASSATGRKYQDPFTFGARNHTNNDNGAVSHSNGGGADDDDEDIAGRFAETLRALDAVRSPTGGDRRGVAPPPPGGFDFGAPASAAASDVSAARGGPALLQHHQWRPMMAPGADE